MNAKETLDSVSQAVRNKYVLLGVRFVLGAIFILAAVAKLPQRAEFVNVVTGFGLLPWDLAEVYGSALPWLELAVGICLMTGLLSQLAAGVSILMVVSFIVANGTAVWKWEVLPETDCGCFGGLILLKSSDALVIDVVMMIMAFLILHYGEGYLGLGSMVWNKLKRPGFHIFGR